jgi:hypothetical protein
MLRKRSQSNLTLPARACVTHGPSLNTAPLTAPLSSRIGAMDSTRVWLSSVRKKDWCVAK